MKSRRSNGLLVGLVVVLVVVVGYLLVWRPRAAEVADVRQERDALTEELRTVEASTRVSSVPAKDAPSRLPLAVAIPSNPDLANLLRQLQAIAVDTGVSQGAIRPAPPAASTDALGASIIVAITATGPKPALLEYVRRLGQLERLLVVDKMSIEPAVAGDTAAGTATTSLADTFKLDISGRTFTSTAVAAAASG